MRLLLAHHLKPYCCCCANRKANCPPNKEDEDSTTTEETDHADNVTRMKAPIATFLQKDEGEVLIEEKSSSPNNKHEERDPIEEPKCASSNEDENRVPTDEHKSVPDVRDGDVVAKEEPNYFSDGEDLLRCTSSNEGSKTTVKKKPNGISIHYLKTHFLREVEKSGKSRNAKVYEIEDLNNSEHGVIRSKGASVICPRDKETIGAAYVDCLSGSDNVGPATFLLSYCWQYKIGDIIDALDAYCERNNKDPKRTYAWICCFCNNQHRVFKQKESGINISFEEFHGIFRDTVVSIGHVVMMMEPFKDPIYVHRIWCIFEAYTGTINNCIMDIIMPPSAKDAMIDSIRNMNNLFKMLANIKIENAKAYLEEDRRRILELVEKDVGYAKLNEVVNALLRKWIMDTLEAEVAELECTSDEGTNDEYIKLCFQLGEVMYENGKHDKAFIYFNRSLEMRLDLCGPNHPDTAESHHGIGLVHYSRGDYDHALIEYKKVLAIRLKAYGSDDPYTAMSHNNVGDVYRKMGDYDRALVEHKKALEIKMNVLGPHHPITAASHNNLGLVYEKRGDHDRALLEHEKALKIKMKENGADHPHTATSYNNIGMVYQAKGYYSYALTEYQKALEIFLKVHGANHPSTAMSYNNLGNLYLEEGDYDNAIIEYQKALEIRLKVLATADHPLTADTHNNIGVAYSNKGDYEHALVEYQKALDIRVKVLGPNHPDTAQSHNNTGVAYGGKGEYDVALIAHQKALDIYLKALGQNHPATVRTQENIDRLHTLLLLSSQVDPCGLVFSGIE